MAAPEIERLIGLLGRLPGLGPRSARRAVLHLVRRRDALLEPLADAMAALVANVKTCSVCGNIDASNPCAICADTARDDTAICVVEQVGDLWAIERTNSFRGRYHVLGGTLSALSGTGPEELRIGHLLARVAAQGVKEVVIATNATVDGQTTAHYIAERLAQADITVTRLAHGVPVGGELDYLDDGTLIAALRARRQL